MNRYLSRNTSIQLLRHIKDCTFSTVYDYEKHKLAILDKEGNEQISFRLPIVVPPPDQNQENTQVNYIILLVQSGSCAMGYFEDGVNLDHKVFRSYMVRKKQGTSQIKYLKTKGKSRAGSRVRLGETMEFFENINERLQEYFDDYKID
ncbi:MAG TPA: hypothetical protein VD908_02720, partial [Cytophagales bacterium]|nr:hypothetical protein [Cytophagales bacterium]